MVGGSVDIQNNSLILPRQQHPPSTRIITRGSLIIFTVVCLGLVFSIVLGAVSPAFGQTILYVAPDANCGTGTIALNCYADLQTAANAAHPGAEVRVASGTYIQSFLISDTQQILILSKTLTVRGGYTITDWNTSNPLSNPTVLDAQGEGRGIVIISLGSEEITPTLQNLSITGGDASRWGGGPNGLSAGGGIYVRNAQPRLANLHIYSNTASYGGGIAMFESGGKITKSIIQSNHTVLQGGGAYLRNSPARVTANSITTNTANADGGGLYLSHSDGAHLDHNKIVNNRILYGTGGGIACYASAATFEANIIVGNQAYQQSGGGIALHHHSDAMLTNNVIAHNSAEILGSGIYVMGASPTLHHTTLLSNTGGEGSGVHVREEITWDETISSTVRMSNTLLAHQDTGIYVGRNNKTMLAATLWYSNTTNWRGDGQVSHTVDITGTLRFLNPADGDYHLTLRSAARDAGIDSGVGTDIDGQARPIYKFDIGADEYWGPALLATVSAKPAPVKSGERLTYTIRITNTGGVELQATITDTPPAFVLVETPISGTLWLPTGQWVWQTVLTAPGGTWTQDIGVKTSFPQDNTTLLLDYLGPLTNVVEIATHQSISTTLTHTTHAVLFTYLPIVMRHYITPRNVLVNPGFEGIGVPEGNNAPNPDNWTRETHDGVEYGEIFTPEGWVTWWEEEGDKSYGRPEARVIPKEIPYTFDPIRIQRGYYAAMYFSFYRTHHAGFYQRVPNLPPGTPVTLYAHAQGWSCTDDDPLGYSCGDLENLGFYVGIDPDGGTDPWSPDVIWCERTPSPDVYRKIGPVQTQVGEAGAVTVFLRSDVKWPFKHNDAYWDSAALMAPLP